jgi:hypothetical protein
MSRKREILIWIAIGAVTAGTIVVIRTWLSSRQPAVLVGAVLRDDLDPSKQSPIANVFIQAIGGSSFVTAKSDASGFFRLTVHPGLLPSRPITLKFEHAEYQPLDILAGDKHLLYVVRMIPLAQTQVLNRTVAQTKLSQLKNVRIRYLIKNQRTINVGSFARQFEVVNTGNVPCNGHHPCSPDGRWKATSFALDLDAQKENEFRNVRASCIAGPCPFTRLGPENLSRPARKIEITALDWSDTASFLVEADVTRTMVTDSSVQSFPYITGDVMSFALPPSAEGPSVVADLNGEQIVFPLGPKLMLEWATCSLEDGPSHNQIYRCELKPGYQFQP